MKKYKHNVSSEISLSYIVTKKKLTFIAALGVTIGLAIFVFMNSMMKGFNRISNESIFKTASHIRLYKDDETSRPLIKFKEPASRYNSPSANHSTTGSEKSEM